ncbi:uncharacterized protein LOC130795259 [Actinidia eriantha]|uniref:uncharacterized protein LOC130795259 n=1 Tax=Actinidia eriantha TaxID=165200 RepID=UPI0025886E25|nr:uncharacterized protein LOC130795259 [Actinidia eriantha]
MLINLPIFRGVLNENPYTHVELFEEIVSTVRVDVNIRTEWVKLRLFPFSLKERAKEWFSMLRPGSIRTWVDLQKEFYKKYFSISRTTQLKRAVTLFEGRPGECFHKVWERFNECVNTVPHHGFIVSQLVSSFYEGLTSEQRQFVEALSNGRFLSKTPEEAWDYFDELTANNQTWEMAGTTEPTRATGKYVLHDVGDDDVRTQLVKLTRQLEMLTTKKVHEVSTKEVEPCRLCEGVEHSTHDCPSIPVLKESFNQGEHISVNAMNSPNKINSPFNNTYNPGWRSHPDFSWRENQNQNQGNFNNPPTQNQFQNQYPPQNQQGYGSTNFAPQSCPQGQPPYQAPHRRSNLEDTLNAFMQKQNDINSQNAQTLQSHTQALNDIHSHLSKLTTSMEVAQNERGKFPSQPQPNPQGQHSVGSSNEGHMEHLKAVTTLRSGREVDKTIYPKATNTTGVRTATNTITR